MDSNTFALGALVGAGLAAVYMATQQKEIVPVIVSSTQTPPLAMPPVTRVAIDRNAISDVPATYRQVGYMVSENPDAPKLPIYGKDSATRRGRANYYTILKGDDIKVPIYRDNRDCMQELACNELYDGDAVIVPDYDPAVVFSVKMYQKYAH